MFLLSYFLILFLFVYSVDGSNSDFGVFKEAGSNKRYIFHFFFLQVKLAVQ